MYLEDLQFYFNNMEIIKHGNQYKDPEPPRSATCLNCLCEFTYDKSDVDNNDDRRCNHNVYDYFVRCPECGRRVIIGEGRY